MLDKTALQSIHADAALHNGAALAKELRESSDSGEMEFPKWWHFRAWAILLPKLLSILKSCEIWKHELDETEDISEIL